MKKLRTMALGIICLLTGVSKAQFAGVLGHEAASGILMNHFTSLLREGTDVSKVERTFAGPVCAKGRVTPEFEDFFDGTGIVLVPTCSGVGSVEYDPRKMKGLQSTKLNVGGNLSSYFTSDISPVLNWKHKSIKFRFYIPPAGHNIQHVDIRLHSEGTQYTYVVWYYGSKSPRTGWIEYSFTPTNGYNSGDLVALDAITIGVIRQNNEQPAYILVNGLTVWDGRLKMPLYCCTFDDNYIRQYEAAKHAVSKGIPVSLFINKNWSDGFGVGSTHGMTLAQNQELEELSCIHINHGVSHSPPAPVMEAYKDITGFASAANGSKTELTVPGHGYENGDNIVIWGTEKYNQLKIAIESVTSDTFVIPNAYSAENPGGKVARRTNITNLWSSPDTPIEDLIADIEENRQWMIDSRLGFGAHIFGSPQEWWLDCHEKNLKAYMFGRPRQGRGMGSYGLLTMWDENSEVRSACDTHLAYAYKMLQANVGTLLWTPGTYPPGTLREWTEGGIYEVVNPDGTSENPSHVDWTFRRDRGTEDEGDRSIQIDVWHQGPDGWYPTEGSLQDYKDYIDVVAAHIAAGRLRAVDLRELYESYLYTIKPVDAIPGDLDFDGNVNLVDFILLSENWLMEKES